MGELEGEGRDNLKARHHQLYSDGMFSLNWALLKGQKLIFVTVLLHDYQWAGMQRVNVTQSLEYPILKLSQSSVSHSNFLFFTVV